MVMAAKPDPNSPGFIRLRGVRQNNLKGFDLDVPLGRYVVVTGLSGPATMVAITAGRQRGSCWRADGQ